MRNIIIWSVVALVAAIAIVTAILVWMPTEWLQRASYLATVSVSFFACGLLIVTTGLVVGVLGLVTIINKTLETKINPLLDQVQPLLSKANETVDTAKGTVAYVGEGVVSPLVQVSTAVAAVRGGVKALLRRS